MAIWNNDDELLSLDASTWYPEGVPDGFDFNRFRKVNGSLLYLDPSSRRYLTTAPSNATFLSRSGTSALFKPGYYSSWVPATPELSEWWLKTLNGRAEIANALETLRKANNPDYKQVEGDDSPTQTESVYIPYVASETSSSVQNQGLNYGLNGRRSGFDLYQGFNPTSLDPGNISDYSALFGDSRESTVMRPMGYDENGNPIHWTDTLLFKDLKWGNDIASLIAFDVLTMGAMPEAEVAMNYTSKFLNWMSKARNPAYWKNALNHAKDLPMAMWKSGKTFVKSPGALSKIDNAIDNLALSTAGGYTLDKTLEKTTGMGYGEIVSNLTGLPEPIAEFTNPGYGLATGKVAKIFNKFGRSAEEVMPIVLRYKSAKELLANKLAIKDEMFKTHGIDLTDEDFNSIVDYFELLNHLRANGFDLANFNPETAEQLLKNLPIGETPYQGLDNHWGIPGTQFNAHFNPKNGSLHVNLFGNTRDAAGNLPLSMREKLSLSPLSRGVDDLGGSLSGATLSSTDIHIPLTNYAKIPRHRKNFNFPDISKLSYMDARALVGRLYPSRLPDFSSYSPASFELIVKLGGKDNTMLFYPFPEQEFTGFNSLWNLKVKSDLQGRMKDFYFGDSSDLSAFLNYLAKRGVSEGDVQNIINSLQYAKGAYGNALNPMFDILADNSLMDAARLLPEYELYNVAEQMAIYPTPELVDRFNAFFKDVPGYRQFRYDNGKVYGSFPTVVYKKKGGTLVPKRKRF